MSEGVRRKRIWSNISRYKFRSVFVRNTVINIVFIIIPLMFISGLVYWNSSRIVENEVREISSTTLIRNRDLFDALLKKTDYVSATFARMAGVTAFLSPSGDVRQDYNHAQDVLKMLKPFVLADDSIDSIYIYSERREAIITLTGVFAISSFRDTNWMDSYRSSTDILPFRITRVLFDDYLPVISVIKPIRNMETGERLGAVVINILLDRLTGSVVSDNTNEELAVLGDNGVILFSDNRDFIGLSIDEIPEGAAYRSMISAGEKVKHYRDRSAMLVYEPSARDSLIYLMKIPLDRFEAKFRNVWKLFILLVILSFLSSLTASVILSINSYRPIDRLLDFIKNPGKGGQSQFKNEEIREIASSMLTTVNTNRSLREELVGKLSLIEKTRISALQAQINPHFLYNTLDAIRWNSMELTGENDVSGMIASLARLLRLSLDTRDNTVPVREETEHAELFCRLLDRRYPGKFRMEWDLEEGIGDYLVLKLCLQPLIENACYHGIKPTRRKGIIRIEGRMEKEFLHFRVIDNGKGIPADKVTALNRDITEDLDLNDQHIGLKNVNQRIKLVFGENWGLTIGSDEEQGTTVDLYFPRMKDS